jgi:hypothetical protein
VVNAVRQKSDLPSLIKLMTAQTGDLGTISLSSDLFYQQVQAMEHMLNDGWLRAKHSPKLPVLDLKTPREGKFIHTNHDIGKVPAPSASSG